MKSFNSFSLICFILFYMVNLMHFESVADTRKFVKPQVSDVKVFDANNISACITNYGSFFREPITNHSGFEWPKGSGKYAIYSAGLWMGARVENEARVAVADYSYEFRPGTVDQQTHLPNNPQDPKYRVFQIQYPQYTEDYYDWPIEDGAPTDYLGNPLIIGNQTLYCVYNDADPAWHVNMGSPPLGIEVQQTVFGWSTPQSFLQNSLFIRWLIINKSENDLDSTYITIWSDPDLGDSGDDFVGCDTTLSLGYCYNAIENDNEYGENPPAVGFQILQGPLISSTLDSANFMGRKRSGYKNLPMTSFVHWVSSNNINGEMQSAKDVYNYMQAHWLNGQPITYGGQGIDPSGIACKYMYSGDPESTTGWLDSTPADRRFMMSSGPFHMSPGDSQEVMIAALITRGTSHLNSVSKLKELASILQVYYESEISIIFKSHSPEPPWMNSYHLLQNYPNPFNNVTRIRYTIPAAHSVKLEIFNAVGERVKTLVNAHQEADTYEVIWDASGFGSGIYFARLTVAQYSFAKKLLLMK